MAVSLLAKSAISFVAVGGGVSAIATPIFVGNKGITFTFISKNGDVKKPVWLVCEPKEGMVAYPKDDVNSKTLTCGYLPSEQEVQNEEQKIVSEVNRLKCSRKDGDFYYRECFTSGMTQEGYDKVRYT
ncbi:hypothetical protein MHLP_01830 [Candidatus Mycoplasma haematolamae str. Purdue]|uniref:Uncharacterized protein n=1 Tax=Mycoplasma haematolamae (strain Purdue) TaxID=1212765 RepID=I7CFG8_MYCHA|nr:hypothetical protein [Candidatus Mycoplasma haematolamae]AFO51946.1 hypothetical protein MHLP_01830 [Candidatus Mycoplasma haematolamae str. Purdue]